MRLCLAAACLLASLSGLTPAAAEPAPLPACQTPAPCKILILSRDEEEALVGPNKVLDTAQQGRPLDLTGIVSYFRDKIRNAPAGASPAPAGASPAPAGASPAPAPDTPK